MAAGCGVDTSFYRNDWHDVAPLCEVVLCEFEEAQAYREAHPPKSTTARAVRSQHAAAHDDGRQGGALCVIARERAASHEVPPFRGLPAMK